MPLTIPPPTQPAIDLSSGQLTEPWYRYFNRGNLEFNSTTLADSITALTATVTTLSSDLTTLTATVTGITPTVGTWTPALAVGGSSTGVTYSTQVGGYIKSGKQVLLFCRLIITNNGTGSGAVTVSGFATTPGTPATVAGLVYTGSFIELGGTIANALTCLIDSAGTTIQIFQNGVAVTEADFQNDANFGIFVSYYTA